VADCVQTEFEVALRSLEGGTAALGEEPESPEVSAPRNLVYLPGLRARAYRYAFDTRVARWQRLRPLLERWDYAGVADEYRRQQDEVARWYWPPEPGAVVAKLEFPTLTTKVIPALRAAYLHLASTAGLRALLAVDAYRKRFGRYPDRIEQACEAAGIEIPRDPATGTAVGYRLEEGVPIVWLPGMDGRDDGGSTAYDEQADRDEVDGRDLVFR
jgi:hypothetical protein